MAHKTLLALGSGLDSTYLLYTLAKDTDEIIHCFQMDCSKVNEGNGLVYKELHSAEKRAGKDIVAWISKNIRSVTREIVKVNAMQPGEWLTPAALRVGAKLVKDFDRMVTGRTWENTTIKSSSMRHQELWTSFNTNKPLVWPLMGMGHGRAHALAFLPKELLDLVSPCQKSKIVNKVVTRCNTCPKCIRTNEARDLLDSGVDPNIVYDYQLKKKGAGPYSKESPIFDEKYYKPPPSIHNLSKWR